MKSLEQQENLKDQENIETTYKKSPERTLTLQVNQTESPDDEEGETVQEEPKTLLQSKTEALQEPAMTIN
jgi:hypothetical protein